MLGINFVHCLDEFTCSLKMAKDSCVCVFVRARARVHVCVCACVCVRARARVFTVSTRQCQTSINSQYGMTGD